MRLFAPAAFAFLVLASCGVGSTHRAPGDKPCDMATIEQLPYCSYCHRYVNEEWPADAKGNCAKCGTTPGKIECCVKTIYACEEHGTHAAPCAEDATKHCCKARKDPAPVEWFCDACGKSWDNPGACDTEHCKKQGQPLMKACSASGDWPHGGELYVPPPPRAP